MALIVRGTVHVVYFTYNVHVSNLISFLPFLPTVPQSPPVNFTVTNITANSITLEWNPPLEIDINGIIERYVIRYQITEQLGVESSMLPMEIINEVNIIGNTTLNTVVTDLDNYTVYMISVTAVTVGEGPVATLSQRTDENGKHRYVMYFSDLGPCYMRDKLASSTV